MSMHSSGMGTPDLYDSYRSRDSRRGLDYGPSFGSGASSDGWIQGDAALARRKMKRRQWTPGLVYIVIVTVLIAISLVVFQFKGGRMSDIPSHNHRNPGGPIVIESPLLVAIGMFSLLIWVFWFSRRSWSKRKLVGVRSLWQGVTLLAEPGRVNEKIEILIFSALEDRIVSVPAWHAGRYEAALLHCRDGWIRIEGFRPLESGVYSSASFALTGYDKPTRSLCME